MSNSALLRAKILALVSAKIIALPDSQKGQLVTIANSSPREPELHWPWGGLKMEIALVAVEGLKLILVLSSPTLLQVCVYCCLKSRIFHESV